MKLLFVDCCVSQRGGGSRAASLCRAFPDAWQIRNSRGQAEKVSLAGLGPEPLAVEMPDWRDTLFRARRFGDPVCSMARQLAEDW